MMEIPPEASQALAVVQQCLGDSVLAVYLHGSAVAGGLRPMSDVDLMVIVNRPTTPLDRQQLVAELLRISGRYPPKPGDARPLEVIVFQRADLSPLAFPPRSEFLYGEWLREAFEAGAVPEPAANPDSTLVLAQARLTGVPLMGPPPAALLPPIPVEGIRSAITQARPALLADLRGDERNVLLTLARMWRTLATGEFVPKDVAADWAMERLPAASGELLGLARDGYLGTRTDDWRARHDVARRLADEMVRASEALN